MASKAELDRLGRALKAADEAGDEEAAKTLAAEIRRLQAAPGIEDAPAGARFLAGTSVGVAKTVGLPVDIINGLLSLAGAGHEAPLGGSRNIQSGLAKLGMSVPPGTEEELGTAGRVGEVVGTAAASAPAIVAGGVRSAAGRRLATPPTAKPGSQGVVARQPGTGRRIVEDVAQTAITRPKGFLAGETAAAVTAGFVGVEAAERFPESSGAQAMGEIVGGFTPAGAIMTTRGAGRLALAAFEKIPSLGAFVVRNARQFASSVTPKGAVSRAKARVSRAIEDPDVASERLRRRDVIDAPLTPAQKIGEENLLALERSIMESTPELATARQQQLAAVNRTIRDSFVVTDREVPTHQVKEYFQGLLDTRMQIAAARANERAMELGPGATREDLNRIAREELLNARTAARTQERELHQAIPSHAKVPTRAGQEAYENFRLTLSSAQRGDIPPEARRLLDPTSKGFLGEETTINEVRGLQSKLRETARAARADKKFNKARIADDLAEALKDDIANATGGADVRESVEVAVAFSADLNTRFTRGAVGRLLGSERSGGAAVPEGLTLEVTVGSRGPRAREATDALLEAVRRSGDEEAMRGHIQGFLLDDFRRAAVKGGRVDPKAADRYLRTNQDVLSRFPETRQLMDRAARAELDLGDAERLANPNVSRTAVFLKAPPGREIERVISTSRPREAMEELVTMARNDTTGDAEKGLKAAFAQFLLRKSEMTSQLDVADTPFISGARLTRELDDPQVLEAMQGLYTREEIKRINEIRQTALLLDRTRNAALAGEGIIGDKPGRIISTLGRVLAAQVGRVVARHTGGGTVQTPGLMSSQAQQLMRAGVQDPASRLLTDAIQDEKLFRALMLPATEENQRQIRTRLNAWVVDVLREQHQFDDEDE